MNGAEEIAKHVSVFQDDFVGIAGNGVESLNRRPRRRVPGRHDILLGDRDHDLDDLRRADEAGNHDGAGQAVGVFFRPPKTHVEVENVSVAGPRPLLLRRPSITKAASAPLADGYMAVIARCRWKAVPNGLVASALANSMMQNGRESS